VIFIYTVDEKLVRRNRLVLLETSVEFRLLVVPLDDAVELNVGISGESSSSETSDNGSKIIWIEAMAGISVSISTHLSISLIVSVSL